MSDELKREDTDWWWIDYLENELTPTLHKDLETLLAHSSEDRDSFENFRLLRAWVSESDPLAGVDLETRLRRVHSGIMSAIAKLDPPPPPAVSALSPRRRGEDLEAGL